MRYLLYYNRNFSWKFFFLFRNEKSKKEKEKKCSVGCCCCSAGWRPTMHSCCTLFTRPCSVYLCKFKKKKNYLRVIFSIYIHTPHIIGNHQTMRGKNKKYLYFRRENFLPKQLRPTGFIISEKNPTILILFKYEKGGRCRRNSTE